MSGSMKRMRLGGDGVFLNTIVDGRYGRMSLIPAMPGFNDR